MKTYKVFEGTDIEILVNEDDNGKCTIEKSNDNMINESETVDEHIETKNDRVKQWANILAKKIER